MDKGNLLEFENCYQGRLEYSRTILVAIYQGRPIKFMIDSATKFKIAPEGSAVDIAYLRDSEFNFHALVKKTRDTYTAICILLTASKDKYEAESNRQKARQTAFNGIVRYMDDIDNIDDD